MTAAVRPEALPAVPAPLVAVMSMVGVAALVLPLGRWAFAHTERSLRVRGTLGRHSAMEASATLAP